MASSQYPSRLDQDSIRLVQFTSGCHGLCLDIDHYQLSAPPSFHALSYTWGPPSESDTSYTSADLVIIFMNGCEFKVVPNLRDVLEQLKKLGLAQFYWIDALCINQVDTIEREIQVSIMNRIYKLADQVDIWLGKPLEKAAQVTAMLNHMSSVYEQMAENENNHLSHDFSHLASLQHLGLPTLATPNMLLNPEWQPCVDFFERRWFKRAWIIQEVALAKSAVVLWEDGTEPPWIRWEIVVGASAFLVNTGVGRRISEIVHQVNGVSANMNGSCMTLGRNPQAIYSVRALHSRELDEQDGLQNEELILMLNAISGLANEPPKIGHYFICLIFMTWLSQAGDYRDHIFAFLGVMNEISRTRNVPPLPIRPDYGPTSNAVDIFTEITSFVIINCEHLGFLTMVADATRRSIKNLPSWVPDFTNGPGPNPFGILYRSNKIKQYNASINMHFGVHPFWIDGKSLFLYGSRIATVYKVGDSLLSGRFENCADLMLACSQPYKFTGQDRIEALWRTLVADLDEFSHPADPDIGVSFHYWLLHYILFGCGRNDGSWKEARDYITRLVNLNRLALSDSTGLVPSQKFLEAMFTDLGLIDDETRPFSQEKKDKIIFTNQQGCMRFHGRSCMIMNFRRLFLTPEGYLGIGPASMEIGDEIWLISKCPTPLVLRKVECSGNKYKLMGESYVHGIMHGEAVDNDVSCENICLV